MSLYAVLVNVLDISRLVISRPGQLAVACHIFQRSTTKDKRGSQSNWNSSFHCPSVKGIIESTFVSGKRNIQLIFVLNTGYLRSWAVDLNASSLLPFSDNERLIRLGWKCAVEELHIHSCHQLNLLTLPRAGQDQTQELAAQSQKYRVCSENQLALEYFLHTAVGLLDGSVLGPHKNADGDLFTWVLFVFLSHPEDFAAYPEV